MTLSDSIKSLFQKAKEKDEFEFISTLINYRGMGSKKSSSNLYEWFDAINFYARLYESLDKIEEKTRIGLLLYSTFFESSDLYNILGSLSRITMGYRGSPYLFFKHDKVDRWLGIEEKIGLVDEIITDAGFNEVHDFFETTFIPPVRNAFFHSSYSIENGYFILHEAAKPITHNGHGTYSVIIEDVIYPKIREVLSFFNTFQNEFLSHYLSYQSNKTVKGRFPQLIDIEILGSSSGLKGFVANGSYILLENDVFWTAMNIHFNTPSEVDRFVIEEIERFGRKTTISTNDGALEKLYEIIINRGDQVEIKTLAKIYGRFAELIMNKAMTEGNHFKQHDLYKRSLSFFQRMSDLDKGLPLNPNMACIKYIVAQHSNNIPLAQESLMNHIECLNVNISDTTVKNTFEILKYLKQRQIDLTVEKKHLTTLFETKQKEEFKKQLETI
jgi:hypothetical protein